MSKKEYDKSLDQGIKRVCWKLCGSMFEKKLFQYLDKYCKIEFVIQISFYSIKEKVLLLSL